MAYSTSNPPVLLCGPIHSGQAGHIWFYSSADALSVVRVSGYFSNGYDLGMRAGDIIFIVDNDASPIALSVSVVNAASASAVDIADGTALASTDTD